MKKFIALAVLATTAAHAADRNIYDIMYLPKAGTTYGFTDAALTKGKVESDAGDEDFDGYAVSQTLGYSFSDRFTVSLALNYASIQGDPEGGEKYDLQKGISDPTAQARFRMMDENMQWDILGGATISLMDQETDVSASGREDNDNLQGGHSLFIGTQIGAKAENFQWAISGIFTHYLESENKVKTAGNPDVKIKDDAHNELAVRGDILNKLAEKSYLRSFVSVDFIESFKDDQVPKNETAPVTAYTVGTQYQHLLSQDVLLKAGIDYSTVNVSTGQIDDYTIWTYTVGANYQF